MNKLIHFLCCLASMPLLSFSQSGFEVTINETYTWGGGYGVPNADGTFWVACMKTPPYDPLKLQLVKIDSRGVALSGNIINHPGEYIIKGLEPTSDGGLVVAGTQSQFYRMPFLQKFNSAGTLEWETFYSLPKTNQDGYCAKQTADGGYIIAGSSNKLGSWGNALLVKTDARGNKVWDQVYNDGSVLFSVNQCSDGGYIACGKSELKDGNGDFYILKTNSMGEKIWSKQFGKQYGDYGISIIQTSDGGFVMTGDEGNASPDIGLYKFDQNGNKLWNKTFGGNKSDEARSIDLTKDGGFIIGGFSSSFKNELSDKDYYLIKTDASGNEIWHKIYGGAGDDYGQSVKVCPDGGYFIGGYSNKNNDGSDGVYIIKVNSEGN